MPIIENHKWEWLPIKISLSYSTVSLQDTSFTRYRKTKETVQGEELFARVGPQERRTRSIRRFIGRTTVRPEMGLEIFATIFLKQGKQ